MNFVNFEDFKKFWFGEAEQKLLRCAKEFGIYNKVKKVLMPNYKVDKTKPIYILYSDARKRLFSSVNDGVVNFYYSSTGTKREYSAELALEDKRHFSQVFVFFLLKKISCDYETFENVCKMYDNRLYKGHKIKAFFEEKLSLIKLWFK